VLRRRYELLSPPPIAVVVASGANLRGSPGHGHALGMLVVYVLTEGQVKAAVKETKKKVEKKTEKAADKTEKVLLSSPLSPLYPPFRGSWSMYRGYGYMATDTWLRETVLFLGIMAAPPRGHLDSSSATVTPPPPVSRNSPLTCS